MKIRYLVPFLFACIPWLIHGQYLPGEEWKSLDRNSYFWIYPDYLSEKAAELAQYTEIHRASISFGLTTDNARQYPLILYPWSMVPNGYVTPYNHHSLWYTADPGSETGSLSWLELLAIHEGRHVAQFDALMRSTGRALYFVGGDVLHSLTLGVSPSWLFEGDAVFMETALSESGRGRMGSFQNNFRLLMLEDQSYQYDSFRFPSRKRLPTNAYDFGYFYSTWLKKESGLQSFDDIFLYQAQLPLPLWGTTRAIRKSQGEPLRINFRLFREEMRDNFSPAEPWGDQVDWLTEEGSPWRTLENLTESGGRPWYIARTPQKGYELFSAMEQQFPLQPLNRLSGSGELLVWDQIRYGDRFLNRSESEIWIYNLQEKRSQVLLKGRYYDPEISPDGNHLILLEQPLEGGVNLVIADRSGTVEERVTLDGVESASWPVWEGPDRILLAVRKAEGVKLVRFHWKEGSMEGLTPPLSRPLLQPFLIQGEPAFIVDLEDGQRIYRIHRGELQRLSGGGYGILSAYEEADGSLMILSRESTKGDLLGRIENPQWEYRPFEEIMSLGTGYFEEVSLDLPEYTEDSVQGPGEEDYGPDFFHPYGWGLYSLVGDLDNELVLPLSLMSQDPLNSNFWEMTYYYQLQEQRNTLRFAGQSNLLFTPMQLILSQDIPDGRQEYYDSRGSLFLNLPLGLHRGLRHFSTDLRSGATLLYRSGDKKDQQLWYTEHYLLLRNWQQGSIRDIGSRWEQNLQLYSIFRPDAMEDHQTGGSLGIHFPGPLNQKLVFEASGEWNPFRLTSRIPASKGWEYKEYEESHKFQGLYRIPLLYPEAALGRLVYFSRIRMDLFAENMQGDGENRSSLGGELILDFYPLQIPLEIYAGLRYSYLVERDQSRIQFSLMGAAF